MVDEEIDKEYEYPEDVVEINQHRFVGVRTLIWRLLRCLDILGRFTCQCLRVQLLTLRDYIT